MKKQIIISSLILLVAFSFFFINYFNPINLEPVKSALFTLADFTRTKELRKEIANLKETLATERETKASYYKNEKEE